MPGVSSSFGFNRACELFYGGRTTCFAPPDKSSLVLISTYCIDGIFASPQQILGLGHFLGKGARYPPLNSLKSVKIGGGLVSREFVRIVKGALLPQGHGSLRFNRGWRGDVVGLRYNWSCTRRCRIRSSMGRARNHGRIRTCCPRERKAAFVAALRCT